ncbi:AlpA family phage regulatory protein [Stenotrophomonas sp. PSU_St99]
MGAAENIPEVLLKLEQVEAQTGMKKSYIYREMEKGTFPPKHKVGGTSLVPERHPVLDPRTQERPAVDARGCGAAGGQLRQQQSVNGHRAALA